nr:amino acid permease [Brevibacillus dissolubilis]
MGCTTGTGFFLGSAIAIEKSGFSVLIIFFLAAFGTYFVFDALANMIAQHSEKGSYRTYSKKAFGHWAAFSHGWIYWLSEILILGSQLTALGLFTKFWFPNLPLWVFAAGYAVLGVLIVLLGTKGFESVENVLAVVKAAAILMFVILAILVITGVIGKVDPHMHSPQGMSDIFADGYTGLWTGLIYAFFAFAGIEVVGLMAADLKNPKEAPKSGKVMLTTVALLYIISLGMALLLAPMDKFDPNQSPFITALKDIRYTGIVHVFNGVLIIAGFSGLVASLFSVTKMMQTIAKDGDAPKVFAKMSKRKIPYMSLLLTIAGMIVSIVIALLLPKKVYEYITTAGGLMLLYTWLYIVFASRKLLKLTAWGHTKSIIAILLILAAISGTLFDESSRPGFYVSVGMLLVIGLVTLLMRKKWKKDDDDSNKKAFESLDIQSIFQSLLDKDRNPAK